MTTVLIQVVLVVTLFSDDAFNFALDLTSALTLIPFLLAAGVRAQAGVDPGDLRRAPAGLRAASSSSRVARDRLHRVPALRGRAEVHPGVVHHLRARPRSCS